MDDLMAALAILRKYANPSYPTHCEHDRLTVCVSPAMVSVRDKAALRKLGLNEDQDGECFYSFRFGSA